MNYCLRPGCGGRLLRDADGEVLASLTDEELQWVGRTVAAELSERYKRKLKADGRANRMSKALQDVS